MQYLADLSTFVKNPAWDVLLILFFLSAGFIFGATGGGRAKIYALLFAAYVNLYVSPVLFGFYSPLYSTSNEGLVYLSIYTVSFIILFVFLDRVTFRIVPRTPIRWWHALMMSFLVVGLFVTGGLSLLAFSGIIEFSQITTTLFVGVSAYRFWAIAPFVGLLILSRGSK